MFARLLVATALVFTAATNSIDLATWYQALRLSGFDGVVIDTRPVGALPPGVLRAAGPGDLARALDARGPRLSPGGSR